MLHIIDNFMPPVVFEHLQKEVVKEAADPRMIEYNNQVEFKRALDTEHIKSLPIRTALNNIRAYAMERFSISQNVYYDPSGRGCGLHILPTNGFLDLHYDGNWHPGLQKLRYANAVLYVLGDEDGPAFHYKDLLIPFRPNRLVIFTTIDEPLHGIPTPCDEPRYTLAQFFYINGPKPEVLRRALFPHASAAFKAQRSKLS